MGGAILAGIEVMVVEDDSLLRKQVGAHLEKLGADVSLAKDLCSARALLGEFDFDFVLLDINLPDGRGIDLLKEQSISAEANVVIMTGEGALSGAVEAMRLGAADYLVKPFEIAELPLVLSRVRRAKRSDRLNQHRSTAEGRSQFDFFFGAALQPMQRQLNKILAADRRIETHLPPVLIQGETGTGKSTIARWLHSRGPRSGQPLVEVNCSALPEPLAESELFGHERGAFTDARASRMGLFEAANGGTLFLDELPSLSLNLQAKVLTAIEDKTIRRLGGNKPVPVDVRLIGAANQDLKSMVAAGAFREDLFHRLDLFRVAIPPLRERGEDIVALAERLLEHLCKRHRVGPKRLHPEARRKALRYPWPGNVRELAHELERAIVFEDEDEVSLPQLSVPFESSEEPELAGPDWFNREFEFPPSGFSLEHAINRIIRHALSQTDNNVSAAARLLGVPRDYVRYRLSTRKF